MKKLTILVVVLCAIPFLGCQDTVDPVAEKEAIKEVIANETNAFWNQDLVKLLETLVQDDNLIYISIGSNGYRERIGYDKNLAYYRKASTSDWSGYEDIKVERTDWIIDLCGESAFVLYNQQMSFKLNGEPMETQSRELRMMKKIKGEWKISMIQWIDLSSFIEEDVAGKEF
jgi:hypothetical protein